MSQALLALGEAAAKLATHLSDGYFSTRPRQYNIFLKLLLMVAPVAGIGVRNGLAASTAGLMLRDVLAANRADLERFSGSLTVPLDCGRPYLHAADPSRRLRRKGPPRNRFFHA
jgi:hypothetical protein